MDFESRGIGRLRHRGTGAPFWLARTPITATRSLRPLRSGGGDSGQDPRDRLVRHDDRIASSP